MKIVNVKQLTNVSDDGCIDCTVTFLSEGARFEHDGFGSTLAEAIEDATHNACHDLSTRLLASVSVTTVVTIKE
jgi:hypothetical protein